VEFDVIIVEKVGCKLVKKSKGSTFISALHINDIERVMLREGVLTKTIKLG